MVSSKSTGTLFRITASIVSCVILLLGAENVQAQKTLCIHQNANVQTHSNSTVAIFGSLNNGGNFGSASNVNRGKLYFSGTAPQTILGDSTIQADSIHINNGNNVQLNQEFRVRSHAWFDNGKVISDRSDSNIYFLHFLDDASHSGSNNSSFVDGVVRKSGDDAFQFPVGSGNNMQAIAISAPSNTLDHFTAFYRPIDPSNHGMSTVAIDSQCGGSPLMVDISEKEFWYLARTNGNSSVQVNISYDTYSSVNTPAQIMVARWNNSQWESHGNGGNTGSSSDGSITSGNGCGVSGSPVAMSSFGFFTLGASSVNALPVELLEFSANWIGGKHVELQWLTASENNNSHFVIEKRNSEGQFIAIGTKVGHGTSNELHRYRFLDTEAQVGDNFYRLKQVDFDNSFSYSGIRKVHITELGNRIVVYPNPANEVVNLKLPHDFYTGDELHIHLYDAQARLIYNEKIDGTKSIHPIDIKGLPRGVYILQVGQAIHRIIKQ